MIHKIQLRKLSECERLKNKQLAMSDRVFESKVVSFKNRIENIEGVENASIEGSQVLVEVDLSYEETLVLLDELFNEYENELRIDQSLAN